MPAQCPPAPITTPMLTGPSFLDPTITTEGDRGLPTWPWIAWFNSLACKDHAGDGYKEVQWNLAAGSVSTTVGTHVAAPRRIPFSSPVMQALEVAIVAEHPPTGAALIVDILLNGVSIFTTPKLTLPAGFSGTVLQSNFSVTPLLFKYGDLLKINVDQVGAGERGRLIYVGILYHAGESLVA